MRILLRSGKTDEFFTHNKEYEVIRDVGNGDVYVISNTGREHELTLDYLEEHFIESTINQQLQVLHYKHIEYANKQYKIRMKSLVGHKRLLIILAIVQTSAIVGLITHIVLS